MSGGVSVGRVNVSKKEDVEVERGRKCERCKSKE